MELSHFFLGVATGVPVMIVVGPIALLLIEQGLQRGMRAGSPAALGVASADLVFASVSALAGAAAARVLEPLEPTLRWGAIVVLVALAVRLWMGARSDLDLARRPSRVRAPAGAEVPVRSSPSARESLPTPSGAPTGMAGPGSPVPEVRGPLTVAAGFFAVTALNPITIVVFTSIVIGGAQGVGTLGWVLGMTTASLMVNLSYLAVGHGLGEVLDDVAAAWLRMAGSVLIVGLAAHFALTA